MNGSSRQSMGPAGFEPATCHQIDYHQGGFMSQLTLT